VACAVSQMTDSSTKAVDICCLLQLISYFSQVVNIFEITQFHRVGFETQNFPLSDDLKSLVDKSFYFQL
jgi:hypothetical protein